MKKGSFADKMARKAFEKDDVKRSWEIHLKAYGPILEPAFQNNLQARVHLSAALNMISGRNLAGALLKLKALQKSLATDADKAAYIFCFGLYCETAGNPEQAAACYAQSIQYGHSFYLPYLKVAKYYLSSRMCKEAEENFRKAIGCFSAVGLSDDDKAVLGSAYTNLASCLTMQHRYDEARAALDSAAKLGTDAAGRAAAEAVLFALDGDEAKVAECLALLKGPEVAAAVKKNTDGILARTDPMFFEVPVEDTRIAAFWTWFAGYEAEMEKLLDKEKYDDGLTPVARQLLAAFPFLEAIPNVGLGKNAKGYVVELKDYYAVGVVAAYEKLIAACPGDIAEKWQFIIGH